MTVTDAAEAPSAPATPTISSATPTGFTATWAPPANAGPAVTGYDVRYRAGTSGTWTDAGHVGTGPTLALGGLTPGNAYQVQVRAANDEGDGAWSATATATTATPVVTVAPPTLSVDENGTATYTVALDARPTAAVTVAVARRSGSDDDLDRHAVLADRSRRRTGRRRGR